jgi:phosphoserine phosphatase
MKTLFVFDFDDTIVDGNSDLIAMKLLGNGGYENLSEGLKEIRENKGWTALMDAVFKELASKGYSLRQIIDAVLEMPVVNGT